MTCDVSPVAMFACVGTFVWCSPTQILEGERVGVGGLEALDDWLPPGHKWTEVDTARNVPHCPRGHCRHRSYHSASRSPLSVSPTETPETAQFVDTEHCLDLIC